MNATALYVSTCRYILQADFENSESWADLYRLLPYLRQSLSCCVCGSLLDDPRGPSDSNCQHFVCRTCVGGKMLLKPSCSWCKDYGKFAEVRQLRILLSCYKKLCEYIAATPIARSFVGANGESNSTLTILQEGMAINVIHESSKINHDKALNVLDILATVNLSKTRNINSDPKSPGRRRGRRRREDPGAGASPLPPPGPPGGSGNPEAAPSLAAPAGSPPDVRLDGLCNGLDISVSDHLDTSDDHSYYSASVSNSDTPGIKIRRKRRHSGEHKSKSKKKKKKRDKDKERNKKSDRSNKHHKRDHDEKRDEHSPDGRRRRLLMRRKQRHKNSRDDKASDRKEDHTDDLQQKLPNGQPDAEISPLLDTPRKKTLVISGHRAIMMKAGKSLPVIACCRCGTWNRYPGVNTCRGNRCPCFMTEKPCIKCKCRGCRNPFIDTSSSGEKKKSQRKSSRSDTNGESDVDIDVTNV